MSRRLTAGPVLLLALGMGAWAYGVSQIQRSGIGSYGLLASADVWFVLGLATLLAGALVELRRLEPRGWLLGLYLVGLIVAIHSTVPIIYGGTPEYAWVYKHVGIAQALGQAGRVSDPNSIYQEWPALFASIAAVSALAHVAPLSFAAWAPVAFELADALLLLGVFRLLTGERRVAYLAVLLYEGLISWVGQDYLSPQAFGYLLWLGLVLIVLRWLRAPAPAGQPRGRLARLRAPLLAGLDAPPDTSRALRAVAVAFVAVIYLAIVAAHQLTPYIALAGIAGLTVLDVVRPPWLLVLMAAIAGGYLIPRYSLIANDFGGLFSGGNPIQNASGVRGASHAGAETTTALIVRALAAGMWLLALASIARHRRAPGRVAIAAALAFSPFLILVAQSYGGEAIYRVYLFSAPWCALLIAGACCELRAPARGWLVTAGVCAAAVFAGLQGLYGPVLVNAVTPAELDASTWLYGHIPRGSLIVLPADNFPVLETAAYNSYGLQVMPSDPQDGEAWLDEANLSAVDSWMVSLGYRSAYVVFSRGMGAYASYFGAPSGFAQLSREVSTAPGWSVVYRNADTTIYRVNLDPTALARLTAAPAPAAAAPAMIASARVTSPQRRLRTTASGRVRKT